MKRSILAVLFAACLIFVSMAFAEDPGKPGMRPDQSMGTTRGAEAPTDIVIKADDLIGKTVQDRSGNDIGKVDSVALDATTGTAYALISVDNKFHPVPITAITKTQDKYSLNVDKSKLSQSPSVSKDTMEQQMANRSFDAQVYRFFGMAPPWGPARK